MAKQRREKGPPSSDESYFGHEAAPYTLGTNMFDQGNQSMPPEGPNPWRAHGAENDGGNDDEDLRESNRRRFGKIPRGNGSSGRY